MFVNKKAIIFISAKCIPFVSHAYPRTGFTQKKLGLKFLSVGCSFIVHISDTVLWMEGGAWI